MTLNKAIQHGKDQLEIFGGEHKEFIQTAIEIMRKYQQIEQIVTEWSCGFGDGRYMYMVGKVVEDGNDD